MLRLSVPLALLPVALLTLFLAVFPAPVAAQWSPNPATNLVLSDRSSEQVQAKVVATADGGAYVSWFDNAGGGYDVYLQRVDAEGNEQWAHNGVQVADRGFSSTQDYGLGLDTAGNALLAFRDDSGANVQVRAAKVSPDGTLVWGMPGIQVSSTTAFVSNPKITGTSDGHVVVTWGEDAEIHAQKLDAAGMPLWGAGVVLAPAAGSFLNSDLRAAESGNAILSFVQSGGGPSPRHLWAQKLASANGASLWAAGHVKVYDAAGGSLQFGNFPAFLPDGVGGAVFAWYTSSPSLQCRVQHVRANGTEAFTHNGLEVSTNAGQLRVDPSVSYQQATGEIFVFWTETNTLQDRFGLYGQKFDAAGVRQWSESGKTLIALGVDEIRQVRTLAYRDGALIAWAQTVGLGNQPVRGTRVDQNGDFVWSPTITNLATAATATSRLAAALSTRGFGIYAWTDGASAGDLLAQNLNGDGSLGIPSVFEDGFESGGLGAWSLVEPGP